MTRRKDFVPSRIYSFGTPFDRAMRHVELSAGCWRWTGALTSAGYGHVNVGGGKYRMAHVLIYEEVLGPIPDGLELDHLCRNHACVRPDHLEAVTHLENVRRGRAGWPEAARTRCPRGHAYDEDNTKYYRGMRYCRACRPAHDAARYARSRQ
jgi:hypothetical protein